MSFLINFCVLYYGQGVRLLPEKKVITKTKTERILSIYHMFKFFDEVSMQELKNYFGKISAKTFSRDIALLKRAGVPIRFSGRRKAFVLVDETGKEDTLEFATWIAKNHEKN